MEEDKLLNVLRELEASLHQPGVGRDRHPMPRNRLSRPGSDRFLGRVPAGKAVQP